MKFRLTYEGELRPSQRDPVGDQSVPLAAHKHAIRRQFHRQLKEFWATDKFLSECDIDPRAHFADRTIEDAGSARLAPDKVERVPLAEAVADRHQTFGYRFVPLVLKQWFLVCSLDILFLRRDIPGSALHAGDIDNRIKTIIDALRPPISPNELVGDDAHPGNGEDPFFCLIEDDNLVSHFSVETDRLLDPATPDDADKSKARVIITVELRAWYATLWNSQFVG